MKKLLTTALATAAGLTILAAPAHASGGAGGDVMIHPTRLERGNDVSGPHFDGNLLVDGSVRITVPGFSQRVLATAPDQGGYVVQGLAPGGRWRTMRVAVGAKPVVLVRRLDPSRVLASSAGDAVVVATSRSDKGSQLEVRSTLDGADVARHGFPGFVNLLDYRGTEVVVGGDEVGGAVWTLTDDEVRPVTTAPAYAADLAADRIATYDGNPRRGGCSVVAELDSPTTTLWRSCRDRVAAFSSKGTRMATIPLKSQGLGPTRVSLRSTDGQRLAGYRAGLAFVNIRWTDERHLLLGVYGYEKGTTARCTVDRCVRVSALETTPIS